MTSPISLGTACRKKFFFFYLKKRRASGCSKDINAPWILTDRQSIRNAELGGNGVQTAGLILQSLLQGWLFVGVPGEVEVAGADRRAAQTSPRPRLTAVRPARGACPVRQVSLPAGWAVTVGWGIFIKIQRGCGGNHGILISAWSSETDRPGWYPSSATYSFALLPCLPKLHTSKA